MRRLLPVPAPRALALSLALLIAAPALAAPAAVTGPVFTDFGAYVPIASDLVIPPGTVLRHVYDVTAAAPAGQRHPALDTAARFINSHVGSGVPAENVKVALVVHGQAIIDLTRPAVFTKRRGGTANPSEAAIASLIARGVRIIVCGQAAAALDVAKADLLPGVEMAISASSAHALLQAQGYSLNPF